VIFQYFSDSLLYFVEAPSAAITASSLLGYDATSLANLYLEFLPFSADPLKLCQVGWGVSLHSYFQVSPEMLDRVQVWALAQGHLETCTEATPALSWLCE
jgi:hypothetical protein